MNKSVQIYAQLLFVAILDDGLFFSAVSDFLPPKDVWQDLGLAWNPTGADTGLTDAKRSGLGPNDEPEPDKAHTC